MAAILMPSFAPAILDVFGLPNFLAFILFLVVVAVLVLVYLVVQELRDRKPNRPRPRLSAGELTHILDARDQQIRELNAKIRKLEGELWLYKNQSSTPRGASRQRLYTDDSSGIIISRPHDQRDPYGGSSSSAKEHHDPGGGRYPVHEDTQAAELCRRYNEGAHNGSMRTAFREKYQITRISTTNVDERRRNPNLRAEYNTSNSGEFFVVELQQGGRMVYAAVPQFDLEINELRHGPGAVGEVFDCRGYQPGGSYRSITVVRPAYFTRESDSGWKLDRPGMLDVT